MKKKLLFILILFVLSINFSFYSLSQDRIQLRTEKGVEAFISNLLTPRSSATDEPIHINGNSGWSDFKDAGNCTGQGTYSDPYIIQNLEIDGEGVENCILIENSDIYFKIENVTVFNTIIDQASSGIKLLNVSNAEINNNTIYNNQYGIYLRGNNNTISGNTVSNNILYGIGLFALSHNNTISENLVYDNQQGIVLFGNGNIVQENTASNNSYSGISIISFSNDNIVTRNMVGNNGALGINLEGNSNNASNNTINHNSIGITLVGNNHIISGNTVSNNNNGIILSQCNRSIISKNIVDFSLNSGISLRENSNNNSISGNTISSNIKSGISISSSSSNIVSGNVISDNIDHGVFLDGNSNQNLIYLNCFKNNTVYAYDEGLSNLWDNGTTGNFWENYNGSNADGNEIGDTPYIIPSPEGIVIQDNFPLMECDGSILAQEGFTIPGYDPFFLIGMIFVTLVILLQRLKKTLRNR